MKTNKILTLLVGVLLAGSVKADGGNFGWQVEFTIETVDGGVSKGYTCVFDYDLNEDSLNNFSYFKKVNQFAFFSWYNEDSLTYFKDRIRYECNYYGEKHIIDKHLNKVTISAKSVKSIRIDDINPFCNDEVVNILKLSDTAWIKKEPIKHITITGFMCSWQIFVHESSPKTEEILKQLEAKQKEYDEYWKNYENTRNKRDDYEDTSSIEEALYKLIEELLKPNRGKVMVLVSCSC